MAGGMSGKRPDAWIAQQRLHGAKPPDQPILPGPNERIHEPSADARGFTQVKPRQARTTPPVRHCWVTDEHGRLPGLLLEWRRTVSGWQGRVVRPVLDEGCWVMVEEWIAAENLEAGRLAPRQT
jgi:hypothetical protein